MDFAALDPYFQDLRPIFSQYGPCAWLIRYICLLNTFFILVTSDACDLYTWGDGTTGMLGHGENGEECVPKVLEALLSKDIVKVACGITHTIVVTSMYI